MNRKCFLSRDIKTSKSIFKSRYRTVTGISNACCEHFLFCRNSQNRTKIACRDASNALLELKILKSLSDHGLPCYCAVLIAKYYLYATQYTTDCTFFFFKKKISLGQCFCLRAQFSACTLPNVAVFIHVFMLYCFRLFRRISEFYAWSFGKSLTRNSEN